MSWIFSSSDSPISASVITGACGWVPPAPLAPQAYTPPPRVWENRDEVVWALTVEYRKPSLGDTGAISTHRTHEGAKRAMAKYLDRDLTEEELSEGAVYGEDETLYIAKQELDD